MRTWTNWAEDPPAQIWLKLWVTMGWDWEDLSFPVWKHSQFVLFLEFPTGFLEFYLGLYGLYWHSKRRREKIELFVQMISLLGWACFDWDKLIHHSSGDISENVPSDQEGENTFVYLTSKSVSMCSQDSLSKEKYFAKYISLQKEMFLTKNISLPKESNTFYQKKIFWPKTFYHKMYFTKYIFLSKEMYFIKYISLPKKTKYRKYRKYQLNICVPYSGICPRSEVSTL